MNIITAIREGRLFEANELIREGLTRSMLSAIYSNCPSVMKEAYGGPGAGVISEDDLECVEECDDEKVAEDTKDKDDAKLDESFLAEARDKAGWQAYIGRLNASVVEKQHQIAAARQRVGDLRRKKAKPESISKANEAIAKRQAGLGNLKKRVAEAQKKYQEWLKKEAEKAKKAREKAKKKSAPKKPAQKSGEKK